MEGMSSERLRLDRPEPSDIDSILRVHGDPRTYAHHPDGVMHDRAAAEELYALWHAHWDRHGFGYGVLRHRDGPEDVLGFAGLKWQDVLSHRILNLYYRLAPEAWGRGYATEVAGLLVDWAGRAHPATPVLARVAVSNPASQRVAEAVGLQVVPEIDPLDPVPHRLLLSWAW